MAEFKIFRKGDFQVNAQIFVKFDKNIKKTISLNTEGYVRPLKVYYGFTNDRNPNNNPVWYNLKGKPGSEVSTDLYTRLVSNDPPVFNFEGFKVKINPFLGFKKIVYRVNYCYKYKHSHNFDKNNSIDGAEVYIYEAPTREFWEAVTY